MKGSAQPWTSWTRSIPDCGEISNAVRRSVGPKTNGRAAPGLLLVHETWNLLRRLKAAFILQVNSCRPGFRGCREPCLPVCARRKRSTKLRSKKDERRRTPADRG